MTDLERATQLLVHVASVLGEARDAALEEAALVCDEPARRLREELGWSAEAELLERYAAAIRALKGKKQT